MENSKLPRDALINILARLPVRSLMRFKCVCKYFYDLIKNDHQFMHEHYEFSRAKNNHCVVLELKSADFPRSNLLYYLLYKESEFSETRCIYLDMPNSKTSYVKCCHGMLCMFVGKSDLAVYDIINITSLQMSFDVFILNPFTREIKALPCIKVPNKPPIECRLCMGFGFGMSKNMALKIVMLLSFQDRNWQNKDSYEIVMVCSRVDDCWSWRKIDAVPNCPRNFPYLTFTQDFYLKGKYYWQCSNTELIWFDMDDEVFGKIEIPSKCSTDLVTIMNETIAVISYPGDEDYIEIWLMDENNNNNIINWKKQASIQCSCSIHDCWIPVGIWNASGHLLVFSSCMEVMPFFKDGFGPDLISIDLVTQENKIVFTSQERKSAIYIGLNPAGQVQVCNERNINKAQEWNDSNISWYYGAYARVFNQSIIFH